MHGKVLDQPTIDRRGDVQNWWCSTGAINREGGNLFITAWKQELQQGR
jgi:hypothetical protein